MLPVQSTTISYLDTIFEGRNKDYGAYYLRVKYHKNAIKAVITSCLIFTLSVVFINQYFTKDGATPDINVISCFTIPPDIKEVKMTKIDVPLINTTHDKIKYKTTQKFVQPKIVDNDKIEQKDKYKPIIDNVQIGHIDLIGSEDVDAVDPDLNAHPDMFDNNGAIANTVVKPVVVDKTPVRSIANKPVFNGDLSTWLSTNIHYPKIALETQISGTVIVEFVVDEYGNVVNARIVRGLGGGLNEEALRVVNSMPKWKPGHQNGVNKAVYYTLPITFALH